MNLEEKTPLERYISFPIVSCNRSQIYERTDIYIYILENDERKIA